MRIASGKVVSGKVEVDGDPLEEGCRVTVLVRDDEETFELSAELESELLASIQEADSGAVVDGSTVLRQLRS